MKHETRITMIHGQRVAVKVYPEGMSSKPIRPVRQTTFKVKAEMIQGGGYRRCYPGADEQVRYCMMPQVI